MSTFHTSRPRNDRRRRGMALYVSVMMTTLIVSLLGLAGIAVVRIERLELQSRGDMLAARRNAHSALELALVVLANDSSWRSNYTSGAETTAVSLGDDQLGKLSWILQDSDGDLTDSDTTLTLQGIGRVGDAVQVVQVELNTDSLACLESAIHCENALQISHADLDNNHVVSSNNVVQETGSSTVEGDVEAVNTISGNGYDGTTTTGVPRRTMPDSSVFDYYLANGTYIDYNDLHGGKIEDTALTPDFNPYGASNTLGIYIIECNNNKVEVKNSVILGTLVLLNAKSDSKIGKDHVYWQPATANLPSLLVSGSIEIHMTGGEGLLDGVDTGGSAMLASLFSGVAVPVSGDVVNGLPSELHGLFYATDSVTIKAKDPAKILGLIVTGNSVSIEKDTEIEYDPTFSTNPPPGFIAEELSVVSGSQTRVAAP